MLSLNRKQMMVLVLILVSFIVALVASMAIIRAANPILWQRAADLLPNVVNNYH